MALNLSSIYNQPGGYDPLQSILGIGRGTPPNQGAPIPIPDTSPDMSSLGLNFLEDSPTLEGYSPSDEATNYFNELLSNYPKGRGILEKIGLILTAVEDPRFAIQSLQQPTTAQRDWQAQIGPAQAGMVQERYSNINLRTLANQILRGEQAGERIDLAGQRLEETGRHNIATEELATWKTKYPNYQLKIREDGMIVGINPQNPQDVQETGVDSGSLSDQEKIDAGIEAAGKAEAGRVSRQKTGIEAGQENIQERERLRAARPPGTRGGTRAQSDINRGRLNRASDVLARNPEYEKFIKLDGTRLSIEPWKKKGILFQGTGITKEEYDSIVSQIYDEPGGKGSDSDLKRQEAITQLEADNKPVNEATIQWMMNKL